MSINDLKKLCYCQSSRSARAAVRALEAAGYSARNDVNGYIYANATTDATFAIATAAIAEVK